MQIGSEDHKQLFCRTFFEGHRRYEPAELPWPELDEAQLALLRGVPLWTHARQFESDAGPMIRAVVECESDPLIREALELQAFEEERHAALVNHMISLYDLPAQEVHSEVSPDPLSEFVDFGFEECLDSFGAFGLFQLVREARIVPDPLFDVFDNVMREESHHIVFFINWYAHRQASRGLPSRLLRGPRSLVHYGKALLKIGELVRDDGADDGADFIVKGAQSFVDGLTPQRVIRTCLAENERRLASFDRRLIVPSLIPRLARIASAALRLVPEKKPGPPAPTGRSGSDRVEQTSRAA
jgi:hypothetical protein